MAKKKYTKDELLSLNTAQCQAPPPGLPREFLSSTARAALDAKEKKDEGDLQCKPSNSATFFNTHPDKDDNNASAGAAVTIS